VSDERERVTAYVDGVLSETERAEVEALIAEKPELREQLEFERDLRARLKALPTPEPRPGFEAQVQSALRARRRRSRAYLLLPLAAALFLVAYLRGIPGFVAFEVARDHAHCFGKTALPAKVWSDDPAEISAWFEKQGTRMPPLPAGLGHLSLVGGRYCPIGDRFAAHVYYAGRKGRLSLFVVPGPLRFEGHYEAEVRGHAVRFLRTAGATLAIVADERDAVDAFAKEFAQTVARVDPVNVDLAWRDVR
jgi:anti-sigma factor RsiW